MADEARDNAQRQAERVEARRTRAKARSAWRSKARTKARERRDAAPAPVPEPAAQAAKATKVRQGIVVSDKGDKTITVRIDSARRHRRYEKIVRSSSTLRAHDERNDAREGDTVRVVEGRPLSRTKRWRLLSVLERAR
jgi:small subunit ribosomal protein S17